MADLDLSAQFGKISERAIIASGKVKAARQSTGDQLESDVNSARDRASAAADQFKDKPAAAGDKASSHWQEMRDKWHVHVATARAKPAKRKPSPTPTWLDADLAESDALDAIDFAQAAIDEAESLVLAAMYARANAIALNS
jgi:hypothetical protein